jgi:hypothetical protein
MGWQTHLFFAIFLATLMKSANSFQLINLPLRGGSGLVFHGKNYDDQLILSTRETTTSSSSTTTTTTTQLFSTPVPTSRTKKKKNLKTFPRYLEIECWKRPELRKLEPVLQAVADSCKQINRIVQRAQTDDLYGVALGPDGMPLEDTNIQGEVQQQLDVLCNTIMLRAFCGSSKTIHSVASEEEDDCRCCSDVMVSTYLGQNNQRHKTTITILLTL